ncbi:MAG: sulfite exporter TauE/SafE family protein [Saprospiraceae bacterium]
MKFQAFVFSGFDINIIQWCLIFLAAFIIGLSKAGIGSISIIAVTIWAWIFGSRPSTGMVLPMLIMADVLAVYYYKRHAQWSHLIKLMPWIVLGVILAAWYGKHIDAIVFKRLMAGIILISLAALFWWERKPLGKVPSHWLFASSMGLATGFTSMIGNLAGGFSNVYFISMRVFKDHFIGTAAWMFFILNLIKLPFHIWSWHTVTSDTLKLDLLLLPAIVLGFFIGVKLVKRLSDHTFRKVILWLTAISSLLVLFQ